MKPNTHLEIDTALCGVVDSLAEGEATVVLVTTPEMSADARGLVHGGFVFGMVDYAAMLAVNDPNVVLGSADVRFVAPVRVGDSVKGTARIVESRGKKRVVDVCAEVDGARVLEGQLVAFVLDHHVLGPEEG